MTTIQVQTILELRRRGDSYAAIAAHIGSSVNTVKSHCLRNESTLQALLTKQICKHCAVPLTQRPKSKQRSFCSDRCRYAWWTAHRDLMQRCAVYQFCCPHCGKNFTAYGNAERKFCSRACHYESRRNAHDS